jgi:hypothetical protein
MSRIGMPAVEPSGAGGSTAGPFPSFKRFAWKWTTGNTLPVGSQKYANYTVAPIDDETSAATTGQLVNTIVAQDIHCQVGIIFQDTNANDFVSVEYGAYFSPQTHHRPEWHKGMFPGGEDEGGAQ